MNLTLFQRQSVNIGRMIAIIATYLIFYLSDLSLAFGYQLVLWCAVYGVVATISAGLVHWFRINRRENQILTLTASPRQDYLDQSAVDHRPAVPSMPNPAHSDLNPKSNAENSSLRGRV